MKNNIKLSIFVLSISLLSTNVLASSSKDLENQKQLKLKQKQDIVNKLNKNKNIINNKKTKVNSVQLEIDKIDSKISNVTEKVSGLQENISKLNKEIDVTKIKFDESVKNLNSKKDLFGERMRQMYMNNEISYIEILLNSKSIDELITNKEFISLIVKNDDKLIKYIKKQVDDIERYKNKLDNDKRILDENKISLEKEKKDYEIANQNKKDYLNKLNNDVELYKKEYEKIQKNWDALNDEIAVIQRQINNAKTKERISGNKFNSNFSSMPSHFNVPYSGGKLSNPMMGHTRISSQFGMRFHPILKYSRMHSGVDMPAPVGTPVIAAKAGVVIVSRAVSGYGKVVMIDHGDIVTVYAHNSATRVAQGQKVNKGDVVAAVGNTGLSTGPHLHFEVRVNGRAVNPIPYLR